MSSISSLTDSLRALSVQLSLLNHQVGARLELKDGDLYCLDVITRHGPLSPSAIARRAGLHPATMTGILDRLERGGWIVRERDPQDRRAVRVAGRPDRGAEVFALYRPMISSIDEICAGYTEAELALLTDFMDRVTAAGHTATERLARPQ